MKRILNFPVLGLVLFTALFLFSCGDDTVDPTPVNVPPVVTLTSSSDLTVEPGETFTVDFSASIGSDSPLKAVTIYEDGTQLSTSRMMVNGATPASSAILLLDADKDGITWTIDIVAQTTAATTVAYEVEVQDDAGGRNSVFVNVTTAGTPPTLTGADPLTFSIEGGGPFDFKLTGMKGTGQLTTLEILEDGSKIDADKLTWNGESMVGMDNPFPLSGAEVDGFDETRLTLDLPMAVGTYVYTMILTDEFSLMDSVEYTVTTLPSGTAIEMREDVIMNADGQGLGGLDLNTGMSVPVDSIVAELVDNGINTNLPVDQNWLRTISPANGASMKYLIAGQGGLPETFLFTDVAFKEDLAGFFVNGVDLTNGATDVVQIEDVFIVEKDGNYWMLEVIEIVTDFEGNDDSYKFDVKY